MTETQFEWSDGDTGSGFDPRRLIVVFALALTLYIASSSPVVFWGDSAEFALKASELELSPIARGYPLHRALSWAAGWLLADPAYGANLVSAFFGAVTVTLVFECGRLLGRRVEAGWAAAAAMAMAHTFWDYSGVAEVYTLHTALLALAILLALHAGGGNPAACMRVGLVLGVSTLHHRLIYFAVPGLMLWLWTTTPRDMRMRCFLRWGLGLLIGALPFALLCIFNSRTPPPGTENPAWWWVQDVFLGGTSNARAIMGEGKTSAVRSAVYLVQFIGLNLPGPALLLAGYGLVVVRKYCGKRVAWPLWTLAFLHLVFPFRYDWTGDQYAFLVPLYPVLALAVAIAVGRIGELRGPRLAAGAAWACALAPPIVYATLAFTSLGEAALPRVSRDWARAYFLPIRLGDRAPETFGERVLSRMEGGDLLHAGWGDGMVFRYLQEVEGAAPGVRIKLWFRDQLNLHDHVERQEYVSVYPRNAQLPSPVQRVRSRLEPVDGMAEERLFRVLHD